MKIWRDAIAPPKTTPLPSEAEILKFLEGKGWVSDVILSVTIGHGLHQTNAVLRGMTAVESRDRGPDKLEWRVKTITAEPIAEEELEPVIENRETPETPETWNPSDFTGEPPHWKKEEGGQLLLIVDEALEPPDPDDYPDLETYNLAWNAYTSLQGESSPPEISPEEILELLDENWVPISAIAAKLKIHPFWLRKSVVTLHQENKVEEKGNRIRKISITTEPIAEEELAPVIEKNNGCVTTYYPNGKTQYQYFRYSYQRNGITHHRHIPGGNIRSLLAQERAASVTEMIQRGATVEEILSAIRSLLRSRRMLNQHHRT